MSLTPEKEVSPDVRSEVFSLHGRDDSPEPQPEESVSKKKEIPPSADESLNKSVEMSADSVLEARKRKFESIMPIDPLTANKKIKLTRVKKESSTSKSVNDKVKVVANKYIEDIEYANAYKFQNLEESVDAESVSFEDYVQVRLESEPEVEKERTSRKKKKKDKKLYRLGKLKKGDLPLSERITKEKVKKRPDIVSDSGDNVEAVVEDLTADEEGDLRTELSRRRAERLNRAVPIQSARLLQSAFRGVVTE